MYENLTPNAKRLINYISPIYRRSLIMQSVFESIAEENSIESILTDDILNQLFPQTATWGIEIWEKAVSINSNPNEDINVRRARVIATLQQETTITPYILSKLVANFTDMPCRILENYESYTFQVILDGNENKNSVDIEKLFDYIDILKPAHLGYNIKINYKANDEIFIGSTLNNCNAYTLYPKTTN